MVSALSKATVAGVHRRSLSCNVRSVYEDRVRKQELTLDDHQVQVVQQLANLGKDLVDYEALLTHKTQANSKGFLAKLLGGGRVALAQGGTRRAHPGRLHLGHGGRRQSYAHGHVLRQPGHLGRR